MKKLKWMSREVGVSGVGLSVCRVVGLAGGRVFWSSDCRVVGSSGRRIVGSSVCRVFWSSGRRIVGLSDFRGVGLLIRIVGCRVVGLSGCRVSGRCCRVLVSRLGSLGVLSRVVGYQASGRQSSFV